MPMWPFWSNVGLLVVVGDFLGARRRLMGCNDPKEALVRRFRHDTEGETEHTLADLTLWWDRRVDIL